MSKDKVFKYKLCDKEVCIEEKGLGMKCQISERCPYKTQKPYGGELIA